jgi:hypothetical protein
MTIQLYTSTVKEQLAVRKDMDINEHEKLSNFALRHKLKVKVKEPHFYCFSTCTCIKT